MTPEPKDFLRGARKTLADVVLPALTDPFAIEQLKTVLRILDHLEAVIDEAYPLEAAEARDLGRFLAAVAASSDPALSSLVEADATAAGDPSFRELRDGNVRRKRMIGEVVRALRRGRANATIETALDELARNQLERERRWTSPRRQPK